MYTTEGGNGLPNNYIHVFMYFLNVHCVKKKKLLCWPKGHLIKSLTAQI